MPTAKKPTKSTKKAAAPVVAKKPATKKVVATPATAADLLKKYRTHKKDNGSTDVQVIGITEKIEQLSKHLDTHKQDQDSRRGLLMMVGKRRRLLNYLKRQDESIYAKLIVDLGLRK